MLDPRDRWNDILIEVAGYGDVDVDDIISEGARASMSRAGTGGDPLRGRDSAAYDDIDDDEKTLGEEADPIDEALASTRMSLGEGPEDARKRKVSAINSIRGQLEYVWQVLGKAETKLGLAAFKADEVDFGGIEKTIAILVKNIKDVMSRIEQTREKVSL